MEEKLCSKTNGGKSKGGDLLVLPHIRKGELRGKCVEENICLKTSGGKARGDYKSYSFFPCTSEHRKKEIWGWGKNKKRETCMDNSHIVFCLLAFISKCLPAN